MSQHKQIFFRGVSFSYLYIAIYLITGILTTPMLLDHFKADYFALLMLVYTLITYLNNIRFGLPELLATLLAKSKDSFFNIYIVKKIFFLLVLLVIGILILFQIAEFFILDWRVILGDVYSLNKDDVINVFYILIFFALIKIPMDISLSTFIGFHEVYLEKIYKIINLIVNFILVLFVVYTDKNIVFFALLAGLLDFFVSLVSFIHMWIKYKFSQSTLSKKEITNTTLFKTGLLFWQLSITQTIIFGAGITIVSHMLSLQDVTTYSLTMKVFTYIFYAFTIINTVLAPLYGKCFAHNQWEDIKTIFHTMILILPILGGFIWMSAIYFMPNIISLWTGSSEFYIGPLFILFFGLFFYLTGYVNSYITLLYSIGEIKSIIYLRWFEVIINIAISILFTYLFGLIGIAIGISVSIAFISARLLPSYIESQTKGKLIVDFSFHKKQFVIVLLPNIIIAFLITTLFNLLIIKIIVFILMSFIYFGVSWYILATNDKLYIMSFMKFKKDTI